MRRPSTKMSLLLALALALAACGGSEPGGSSGADGGETSVSGEITWFATVAPAAMEVTVKAFNEMFPDVQVNQLRLAPGPLSTRYAAERSAGAVPADVVTTSDAAFLAKGIESDWFETELDLAAVAEWPKEQYNEGIATTGLLPLILGYNTDLVQDGDVPQTWEDVLAPKWKGKMLLGDPREVIAFLALAEMWRQEFGDEFLTRLADQAPTLVPSTVPGAQQLAAGSAALLIPAAGTTLPPLLAEGAPIDATVLTPTVATEFKTAVSTGSGSPEAARQFMNFLHTKEGQVAFNTGGGSSVLGKISEESPDLPEDLVLLSEISESALAHKDQLLKLLGIQ